MISGWKINAIHGLVTALSFGEFHHTKKRVLDTRKKRREGSIDLILYISNISHTHTHIYLHHSYQKVDIPKIETHNLTGVEW